MLTVEDIRDTKRKSGFKHVGMDGPANASPKFWAQAGSRVVDGKHVGEPAWKGERRITAEQAAQDYCDFINGAVTGEPQVLMPSFDPPRIDMGTVTVHVPVVKAKGRKRKAHVGKYDLYDIFLYDPHNNDRIIRRKVGITAVGVKRFLTECVTWGWAITPVTKAVTYQTKAKAEKAERDRIRSVAQDPAWRQITKEAFVPTTERTIHDH